MSRTEEIIDGLYKNTLWGKAPLVKELTNEGLELGMTPDEMLWKALIPALEEVGRRFEIGEFFVPEMLIAARAMQGAMDILKPLMIDSGIETVGTFLMLTVKGDMHDIGKNLCNIMLEGAGFNVIDLGVNVAPATIVEQVQEHKPDLVGFSAFLTTTMPMFKVNMQTLADAGLRDSVKVLVGGAPVTPDYATKSGADGYAKDASEIVRVAKKLVGATGETEIPSSITSAVDALQKLASSSPSSPKTESDEKSN
jgi:5-methyltetrahydrofolate--homocysteine methyltransferase